MVCFLGYFRDKMLQETELHYTPDSIRMILYTDGLIEAKKAGEEMYGLNG
jgi:serine phosphatase RsbU (regulator of sigma subunit)